MVVTDLRGNIGALKGIGQKTEGILKRMGIETIYDLLHYYPRAYSDRTKTLLLHEAIQVEKCTVKVKVIDYRTIKARKFKSILKILIQDESNRFGALVCFNRDFLKTRLKVGNYYYITGKFTMNKGEIQASSFEYEDESEGAKQKILPVYSLGDKVNQKTFRKAVQDALTKYKDKVEDELPPEFVKSNDLIGKADSLLNIHFPNDFNLYRKARERFVYEEFFFRRLFILDKKEARKQYKSNRGVISYKLKKDVLNNLPFSLMDYQVDALNKIEEYMKKDEVFSILLQGDVGAGKTLVAVLACLNVVEAGGQAAFMVPTEVLASQHYMNIKKITESLGINIALLTGTTTKADRSVILEGLSTGEIDIVVGTHALFSKDVFYNNLSFAVIDEQHRFGVSQRFQLLSKGEGVDLLLMTATPIPQSLALSIYGDLDLITMQGHISGRKPVKTWIVDDKENRLTKMHHWIKETIAEDDGRALFVYPLIEESDKVGYKSLIEEHKKLEKIYKEEKIKIVYSKVSPLEKEKIIGEFLMGNIKILAATTVVEVGLDIPDANIIVVEEAQNYGLSTLHQLRGRVGRNNKQAYMVLVSKFENLTDSGKERLNIMKNEHDGFKISEQDLILRGPGDYIGKRQSGLLNIKLADIKKDLSIIKKASEDAFLLKEKDRKLENFQYYNTKLSYLHRVKEYLKVDED